MISDFTLKGRVRRRQTKIEGKTIQKKMDEIIHENIKKHCVYQAPKKG